VSPMFAVLALQMPLGLSWGQTPDSMQMPDHTIRSAYRSTVQYSYNSSIEDYPFTVFLNFTPKTEKLWRVDFTLNPSKKPSPYFIIWTLLTTHYGIPKNFPSPEKNKIFWEVQEAEDTTSIYYGYDRNKHLSLSYQSKNFAQLRAKEL